LSDIRSNFTTRFKKKKEKHSFYKHKKPIKMKFR
jgi:hypothetical protein